MDTIEKTLQELKKPMEYKWRVQSVKSYEDKNKNLKHVVSCVAYIDARDVMDRLDETVGGHMWQDEYYEIKGNLFCRIGIDLGNGFIWKSDNGSESNIEKSKGEASDSFKRAAVKWGIGRFLYSLDIVKIKTAKEFNGKYYPANEAGQMLTGDKLTDYCNELLKSKK